MPLSMETLLADLERLGPAPPRRWLVRRDGLADHQNEALDALELPERLPRSRYLPARVLALLFEEDHGVAFLDGPKLTVIYDAAERQAPER